MISQAKQTNRQKPKQSPKQTKKQKQKKRKQKRATALQIAARKRACTALIAKFCDMSHIPRNGVYWLRALITLYFFKPGVTPGVRPKWARISHPEIINKVAKDHPEVAEKWVKNGEISRNYWNMVKICTYLGRDYGKIRKADDPEHAVICCFERFQPASKEDGKREVNIYVLTESALAVLREEFGDLEGLENLLKFIPAPRERKERKDRNIRPPRGGKYKREPKHLEQELCKQAEPNYLKQELRREPEEMPEPEEVIQKRDEQFERNRDAAAELRRRGINPLDYGMPPEDLLKKLVVENPVEYFKSDCKNLQSTEGIVFSSSLRSEEIPPKTPPIFPQHSSTQNSWGRGGGNKI